MFKRLFRFILIFAAIFSFTNANAEDDLDNNEEETKVAAPAEGPPPEKEAPVEVETIVVTARYDYCEPEVMQRRLSRSLGVTCMNCLNVGGARARVRVLPIITNEDGFNSYRWKSLFRLF